MLVRPYGREWARGIAHGLLYDCPSLARQAQGTAIALFYVVVYMRLYYMGSHSIAPSVYEKQAETERHLKSVKND